MHSSNGTPQGKITEEFWQRQQAEWRAEEAGTRGNSPTYTKVPWTFAFLSPRFKLFTRGCEHDTVDSFIILVVTDDRAFIVDAVKIGVPTTGRIQLLPGLCLSTKLERRISARTILVSRTPLWLASGWGCRGRRLSRA